MPGEGFMNSLSLHVRRKQAVYTHGIVSSHAKHNIARIMSMILAVFMLMSTLLTTLPLVLNKANDNNVNNAGISSLSNVIMKNASAADSSDFKGSSDGYEGCPGNDGTDESDDAKETAQRDNDSRQICYLKNKNVDADNIDDSNLSDDGSGKKIGDTDWNYNNLTDNSKSSKYGQDIKNDKDNSDNNPINTNIFATFSMILSRTINPYYYINTDIPDSTSTNLDDVMKWQMGKNACSSLDHDSAYDNNNCDIPGIVTQAYQDIAYLIAPSGIQNGDKVSAVTPFNVGIPSGLLPSDSNGNPEVPLAGQRGSNKYTALEIFGYNLRWTTYNGEWDKIDVINGDRLAGTMKIGSTILSSVVTAGKNAIKSAGQDFDNDWHHSSHWYTAVVNVGWDIVSGPFRIGKDTFTGTIYFFINGVMNGYENNIISQNAWSRNDFYRDTSYNVRMATDIDQAIITQYLIEYITEQMTDMTQGVSQDTLNDLNNQSAFPGDIKDINSNNGADYSVPQDPNATPEDYAKALKNWSNDPDVKARLDWGAANLPSKDKNGNTVSINIQDYIDEIRQQEAKGDTTTDSSTGSSDGNGTGQTTNILQKVYEEFRTNWISAQKAWVNDQVAEKGNPASKFNDTLTHFDSKQLVINAVNNGMKKNNAIFFFCTDQNGNPSPAYYHETSNEIYNNALSAGMKWYGDPAFNISANGITASDCANGKIRQPIVGALNGAAGTYEQHQNNIDTRRTAYQGITFMDLIGNPIDKLTQSMLGISQKIAIGINYIINLSFTPLLDQLGIKDITVNIVKTLKDSLYSQCLQIFIVLGVMVAFLKGLRRSVEGMKQALLVCVAGLIGLVLLYNPEATFKIIDEWPSEVENVVAALMLESASPNEDICGASGTPTQSIDGSKYVDVNGNLTGFNPNATIRQLECNIWDAYVFEPWSLGQFGTSHMSLYAKGHAPTNTSASYNTMDVADTTATLVGDAAVDMGGGTTVNNWALYQLSQQVGGTTTTNDPNQTLLATDTDLYRLVDLQAGPKNATGKVTTYWSWWIGDGNRFAIGALALISSIGGIASIGMFAIAKIEATFMMSILFAIMPIMLLVGIIPGSGRMKMRSWAAKLLGLAFKRVVLVALLCIQLIVLISIANSNVGSSTTASAATATSGNSGSSAVTAMVFMAAMSCIFAMYGKQIISAFTEPLDRAAGSFSNIDDRLKQEVKSGINNNALVIGARGVIRGIPQAAGSLVGSAIAGGFHSNSANSKFARWEDRQREQIGQARDKTLHAADAKRKKLMEAYQHGTITGQQYIDGQAAIDQMEKEAAEQYNDRIAKLAGFRHEFDTNFNFRSSIINDKSLNDDSAGMEQLKGTINRAVSEVSQRQRAVGNNMVALDAVNAVKDEEAMQIQNAYNNIFVNNPQIGRALLGNPKNEKELANIMKGVDFREVNRVFRISSDENAKLTAEEMSKLGMMYTFDSNGNATLNIDPVLHEEFRRDVLEQSSNMSNIDSKSLYTAAGSMNAEALGIIGMEQQEQEVEKIAKNLAAKDHRALKAPGDKDSDDYRDKARKQLATKSANNSKPIEIMQNTFINADIREKQHDMAAEIANKYIPESQEQLDDVKEYLKQAFDNPVDSKKIDNVQNFIVGSKLDGSDSILNPVDASGHAQLMKDIDEKAELDINAVKVDPSLSDSEKKAKIREIRQKAAADKNKYAAHSDEYIMGQAQVLADGMFAAGIDKLVNDNPGVNGISIDKNGHLHIEYDSKKIGKAEINKLEHGADFKDLQSIHDDILTMAAYTGKTESGFSTRRDSTGSDVKHDNNGFPVMNKHGYVKDERILNQGVNGNVSMSDEMRFLGDSSREKALNEMGTYAHIDTIKDNEYKNDIISAEPGFRDVARSASSKAHDSDRGTAFDKAINDWKSRGKKK